jgi:hypothetical protein
MGKVKMLILFFSTLSFITSCAKRGTITGGEKDKNPPKIISSIPKNLSKNFDKKSIKITFDEYIKIKDLQKQLIVSPVMKNPITVLPQGGASKYVTIKINDTLKPNTTYSLNFGQSIVDYNEGNPYPQLKYVFSTGALIDSLKLEGTIEDSYESKAPNFVNVMLYEFDNEYNDSVVFKKTPRYVTNTLDSLKTFKIENIKAGKYKLVALKESNNNYKFDSNKEKIGFYDQIINIPDSSIFKLKLFKEDLKFKVKKPSQASGNRIIVGYEGDEKGVKIVGKHNNNPLKLRVTKIANKDSLEVWINPMKNDSIQLTIEKENYKSEYTVKIRNQKLDTLKITAKQSGILDLNENFGINTSVPIEKFDVTKMTLIKSDSSKVDFKTNYDEYNQQLDVLFAKDPKENYIFKILPKGIEDYLGRANDSLVFKFNTKSNAEYGNLKVNFQNVKSYPFIVELTDDKGKILLTQYVEKEPTVEFLLMEPRKFYLRVIYDVNKNKKRDTGNYLENIQPEEVVHFPKDIDVRANWDVNQEVDLGDL